MSRGQNVEEYCTNIEKTFAEINISREVIKATNRFDISLNLDAENVSKEIMEKLLFQKHHLLWQDAFIQRQVQILWYSLIFVTLWGPKDWNTACTKISLI